MKATKGKSQLKAIMQEPHESPLGGQVASYRNEIRAGWGDALNAIRRRDKAAAEQATAGTDAILKKLERMKAPQPVVNSDPDVQTATMAALKKFASRLTKPEYDTAMAKLGGLADADIARTEGITRWGVGKRLNNVRLKTGIDLTGRGVSRRAYREDQQAEHRAQVDAHRTKQAWRAVDK